VLKEPGLPGELFTEIDPSGYRQLPPTLPQLTGFVHFLQKKHLPGAKHIRKQFLFSTPFKAV